MPAWISIPPRCDLDPAALPDDVQALRAMVLAQHAEIAGQRELIGHLRLQLARLRRMQFGRSSERLDAEIGQLTLALEDLEADAGLPNQLGDQDVPPPADAPEGKPARRPLPEHLPRHVLAGTRIRADAGSHRAGAMGSRHARAGARAGHRQDPDRTAAGLCAR